MAVHLLMLQEFSAGEAEDSVQLIEDCIITK
jgi:hypothetical protein